MPGKVFHSLMTHSLKKLDLIVAVQHFLYSSKLCPLILGSGGNSKKIIIGVLYLYSIYTYLCHFWCGTVLVLFICLSFSRITEKVIYIFFCEIWGISRLWMREELIKFRKVRVKIGVSAHFGHHYQHCGRSLCCTEVIVHVLMVV